MFYYRRERRKRRHASAPKLLTSPMLYIHAKINFRNAALRIDKISHHIIRYSVFSVYSCTKKTLAKNVFYRREQRKRRHASAPILLTSPMLYIHAKINPGNAASARSLITSSVTPFSPFPPVQKKLWPAMFFTGENGGNGGMPAHQNYLHRQCFISTLKSTLGTPISGSARSLITSVTPFSPFPPLQKKPLAKNVFYKREHRKRRLFGV